MAGTRFAAQPSSSVPLLLLKAYFFYPGEGQGEIEDLLAGRIVLVGDAQESGFSGLVGGHNELSLFDASIAQGYSQAVVLYLDAVDLGKTHVVGAAIIHE